MKEVSNKIKIQLIGKGDDKKLIRLNDFVSELNAVSQILHRLDNLVGRSENRSMYFRITDLRYSSPAIVEIEAVPQRPSMDYTKAVVSKFFDGLDKIKQGKAPAEFDRELIESYKTLTNVIRKNVAQIDFTSQDIYISVTEDLDEPIKQIIGKDEILHGFVSGVLEYINIHGGVNKFNIYPIAGPSKVECHFPDELLDKAIQGINRKVNVKGRISYKTKELFPYAISVEDIEIYPDESELPNLFDIKGIAPQATGNLSSEEFVREIRQDE